MCGGEVDSGSLVDEHWLVELERRRIHAPLRNAKTQARRRPHAADRQAALRN